MNREHHQLVEQNPILQKGIKTCENFWLRQLQFNVLHYPFYDKKNV